MSSTEVCVLDNDWKLGVYGMKRERLTLGLRVYCVDVSYKLSVGLMA